MPENSKDFDIKRKQVELSIKELAREAMNKNKGKSVK